MAELIKGVTQFGTGFGKGVWEFGKDTVNGVADLGKAGYNLATDQAYREQAFETAKEVSKQVGNGIGNAVEDPAGTLNGIKDSATSAWDAYGAERAQAAAEDRLAEFDGQTAGRGLSEIGSVLVPVSKVSKLGKAGELLGAAPESGAVKAASAIKAGKASPDHPPTSKVPCPEDSPAEIKPTNASSEVGSNPVGNKSAICSNTETGGCPISMVTGEELLELTDFTWNGPLSLNWTRFYRTAQTAIDLQLGHGWLTPLDEWLDVSDTSVTFHDREGRKVDLPLPEPGDYSLNLPERLRLYREAGQYRLVGEDQPERVFQGEQGHCRLRRWQNTSGHFIELAYDRHGQVQALKASWGKTLLIQRSGKHITAIGPAKLGDRGLEFAATPFVRYQYNDQGDLAAVRDQLDQGESYAYRNHVIVRRTLASGFNFQFEWDEYTPAGRCIHNFGDNGIYDYRFEWTDSGISRAIDSRGGITEYMHDANALLMWQTSPEGRTTHYAYNEANLLCSITDAAGSTTTYNYDDEGQLTAVTDPLGRTSRLAYDSSGKPTTLTDPLGQTWSRSYDEQGRLSQSQDPQGGVTRFVYNDQGLPAQVINAVNQTRTLLWDEQARLVGEIGFDGVRRHFQYDGEERIIAAAQNKQISQYQYDAAGRVIAVKAPDGSIIKLQYNSAGLLTRYTDAAARSTEYRYADGLSQITERIDPAGQVLRYHYDSERNLIGLTNAKGERYQLNYDKDENLTEEIGFDGRVQRYHYDAAGQLDMYAQRSEQDWLLTRFQRDPLGRLLKKTGPDGAVSEFGYDPLGRLHRAQNSHSQLHFHYNPLGQVINETQNDATVAHEYDALGRRTATVTPSGQRIEYAYNAQGRLAVVKLDGEILSRHQFDELGLETARQQGDLVSQYAYDPMGRLTQHQASLGNKATVLGRRYGYDATGKLDAVSDFRQGQTRYFYDPADRLIQVDGISPERFVHDPAGNLIGVNEDSGGLVKGDRLLMMGDRHFSYDPAGNLIEERRGKQGGIVTRYAYDGDNHLIRAETPTGVSHYRYDALGRRIAKQTEQGETRFRYDGPRLLAESDAQRNRTYLFEPGRFRPLARIDQSVHSDRASSNETRVYYYHLDHLGTPREMTDATGRIVWSAQYRAYGNLALADIAEIDNPLRFQGQYFDAETGLHYNLKRYYDPSVGRFIHQDPIGLAGGDNLYQYAPNPVNWVDPWGLSCKEVNFYVLPSGEAVPSTGYRAFGGQSNIDEVMNGTIAPRDPTYITFDNIKGMSPEEAKSFMQLPRTPSHAVEFDTLQIIDDLKIPTGKWNTNGIPEPITETFPDWGSGGATQAITNSPIKVDSSNVVKLGAD